MSKFIAAVLTAVFYACAGPAGIDPLPLGGTWSSEVANLSVAATGIVFETSCSEFITSQQLTRLADGEYAATGTYRRVGGAGGAEPPVTAQLEARLRANVVDIEVRPADLMTEGPFTLMRAALRVLPGCP